MDNGVGERLRQATQLVSPPDDPVERLTRRRNRKRRNERLSAAAVSLVLVGALVGGSLAVVHGMHHGPAVANPAGRGSLAGNGGKAGSAGRVPSLGSDQFAYVKQVMVGQQGSITIESWWANDGSGRMEHSCSYSSCTDNYGFLPSGVFGPGNFPTDDDMTGLSSDPAELRTQLLQRTAPGGKSPEPAFSPGPELTPGVTVGGLLDSIVNILDDPNGSPELKAAAFDIASAQPGVVTKNGVDPAGRPATILEFSLDGSAPQDYYFDPATNLLMAEGASGQSDQYTLYDRGIVGSTDSPPTGSEWLFAPAAP